MTNKEILKEIIELNIINEKKAEFIVKLVQGDFLNKSSQISFIYDNDKSKTNKIDSAYPIGLQNLYLEHFAPETCPTFAYSYIDNKFGELINVDRLFKAKIFDLFYFLSNE